MKRDKIVTLRVNSGLLKQFNDIVNSHTKVTYSWLRMRNRYECSGLSFCPHAYLKFSLADFLEYALRDFVKINNNTE